MKEITILGLQFGQDAISIQFMDSRHTTAKGGIEQILTIKTTGFSGLIEDIEDVLVDVIDKYFLELRNPPDELPAGDARERLRNRTHVED